MGISDYEHVNRLRYADDDAYLMYDFLLNKSGLGYERKDIQLLVDSQATSSRIYRTLERLIETTDSLDNVLIYFAGHGDVERFIERGYLLCYRCEKTNYPGSDAIDVNVLNDYISALSRKNVKVLLVTDACRSGNLSGGIEGITNTESALKNNIRNVTKFLSCQPGELSEERLFEDGGHGVFTMNLVDAMKGMCDLDSNGIIIGAEARNFVISRVMQNTSNRQNPDCSGNLNLTLSIASNLVHSSTQTAASSSIKKQDERGGVSWQVSNLSREDSLVFSTFLEGLSHNTDLDNWYEISKSVIESYSRDGKTKLANAMKEELITSLLDNSQKLINLYIEGELYKVVKDKDLERDFMKAGKELEIAGLLLGESDYLFNPTKAKQFFCQAYSIYKKKKKSQEDFIKAENYLLAADSLTPELAYIKNALGLIYHFSVSPDLEKAKAYYETTITLSPKWTYPLRNLGILYKSQGNKQMAMKYYYKALEIDSTDKYVLNNLGVMKYNDGNLDSALVYLKRSLSIDSRKHKKPTIGSRS